MKIVKKIILILLITYFSFNVILDAKNIELNIDFGIYPMKNQNNTGFIWHWDTYFIDVNEEASIINKIHNSKFNISGGLRWMLNESIGFYISFSSIDHSINSNSEYLLDYTWFDGEQSAMSDTWFEREGKISFKPYTLGLVLRKHISSNSSLVIKGGLSIVSTSTNLYGKVGFAEAFETDIEYRLNWYALDVEIAETDILTGVNIAFEYEKRIARSFDLYAGIEYFFLPVTNYKWQVTTKEFYDQIGEQTIIIDPQIIHEVDGDITTDVKYSNLRAYVGIRYFL